VDYRQFQPLSEPFLAGIHVLSGRAAVLRHVHMAAF
jgi:hypothetical protein